MSLQERKSGSEDQRPGNCGSRGCYRETLQGNCSQETVVGPEAGHARGTPGKRGNGGGSPPPWVWGTTPRPLPSGTPASGRRGWLTGSRQEGDRSRGDLWRGSRDTGALFLGANRWLLPWRTRGRAAGAGQGPRLPLGTGPWAPAGTQGAARSARAPRAGAGAGRGLCAGPDGSGLGSKASHWTSGSASPLLWILDLAFPPDGPQVLLPHW